MDKFEKEISEKKASYRNCVKKFTQVSNIIISFDDKALHNTDNLICQIKRMMCSDDLFSDYKLQAQLSLVDTEETMSQDENVHRFFMRFYNEFYVNSDVYNDKTICISDDTSLHSYRNQCFDNMKEILDKKYHYKQIMIENSCDDQKSYEILFKLLHCAFFHKPKYSNWIILCIKNEKYTCDELLENDLITIFDLFNNKDINMLYTQLDSKNSTGNIKMRSLFVDSENNSKKLLFHNVNQVGFNNCIYRLRSGSINATYTRNKLIVKDIEIPNVEKLNMKCDKTKHVISTIYTFDNTITYFLAHEEMNYKDRDIKINYGIYYTDTKTNVVPKLIDSCIVTGSRNRFDSKKCFSFQGLEDTYESIKTQLDFNPYFISISPYLIKYENQNFQYTENKGTFLKIKSLHIKMSYKIARMLQEYKLYKFNTCYARLVPYVINPDNSLAFEDFKPYSLKYIFSYVEPKWKWTSTSNLSYKKISELLYDTLVLRVFYDINNIKYAFYIKITNENILTPRIDGKFTNFLTLQKSCEEFVCNNVNDDICKQLNFNNNASELQIVLKTITTVLFNDYTCLDHFLNVVYDNYRKYFILQTAALHYLHKLSFDDAIELCRNLQNDGKTQKIFVKDKNKALEGFKKSNHILPGRISECVCKFYEDPLLTSEHPVVNFYYNVRYFYKKYNASLPDLMELSNIFVGFFVKLNNDLVELQLKEFCTFNLTFFFPNEMLCGEVNKITSNIEKQLSD